MSYCRFAWDGSDVYVFESNRGIECCGCRFEEDFTTDEPEQMITHLAKHRRAGHFVPVGAIEALWLDIPGAQRPADGEPTSMTHARLFMSRCLLDLEIKKVEERMAAEEHPSDGLSK